MSWTSASRSGTQTGLVKGRSSRVDRAGVSAGQALDLDMGACDLVSQPEAEPVGSLAAAVRCRAALVEWVYAVDDHPGPVKAARSSSAAKKIASRPPSAPAR